MKLKFVSLAASLTWMCCSTTGAQLPAFPGAEGFGKYATGGRGGTVYHVTNLNDSGPGSFRDAVSQPNRTVVFDVGGVIAYSGSRYAPKPNITIAGQTAPGDGVTLYGNGLSFSGSHNNIVRFLRVRQGINGSSGTDAVGIANGHDMIFDHLSVSWGRDETFSISGDVDRITIQSTIISQGLQTHSAGGLIQTPGGVSILRCLYIDNDTRNPKVKFVNEFVNNVVCNWETIGYNMGGDSAGDSYVNLWNNYFIRGLQSGSSAIAGGNANFHVYATNNWIDVNRDGVLNGTEMSFASYGPMDLQGTPYPYEVTTAFPPLTALKLAISDVGTSLRRDQVDALLIDELTSWGTKGGTISSELSLPTGGPGLIRSGTPYTDTDRDGMPDYWENGTGSNPAVANNNDPSPSGSGYTRLEDYLNWLAEPHGVALTDAVVGVDLRTLMAGFEAVGRAPVYQVLGASNGVVTLEAGVIARFTPNAGLNGPADFTFSVSDADGSTLTRSVNLFFTPNAQGYSPVWHGDDAQNRWDVAGDANWSDDGSLVGQFKNGDAVTFDDSGSTNPAVQLVGALQPASVSVNAAKNYRFAGAGSLEGSMAFGKGGMGTLRIATTNGFTGTTTASNGVVLVNGALTRSPVTVRNGGAIGGNGFLGNGVTVLTGGVVIPGDGLGAPGTLTITNGLSLAGNVINRFDLSDNPNGTTKTNDRIAVVGDLTLTGVNTIKVSLLDGLAGDGVYTLITYTGSLNGGLANLALAGVNGVLTNPPNTIAVIVSSVRPTASLVWNGGSGTWDTGVTANWLNDGAPDRFYFLDTVRFDDGGGSAPTVTLSGSLTPESVTVDSTHDHVFSGGGKISGTGGLTKTNSGSLAITTANDYTGPTVLGGGVLITASLANGGAASGIGASGNDAANLVLSGGALRYTGGSISLARNATLAGNGTFDIAAAGTTVTANGAFTGSGTLIKDGAGTLVVPGANTHSGGTTISNGTLYLSTTAARDGGLGSGVTTLAGGTLRLYGNGGSTGTDAGTFSDPLSVPAGATGSLLTPPRYSMGSTLTGSGTLNLEVDYVRGALKGNWSGFSGTVNATARSNPSEFRVASGTMFNNATVILNPNVVMTRNGGSSTIEIGALGGTVGSKVGPGNSSSSGTTYRIGGNNGDATWSGSFENDGTTTVVKEGTGIWTLTGANTWSGGLTINGGTVRANNPSGSGVGSGAVVVNSGGALGGSGSVSGAVTVNVGGAIAPGAGVGTLTLGSSVNLLPGSKLEFELGTTSDRLVVSGALILNAMINVTNSVGFGPGIYTLINYSGSRSGTPVLGTMPAGFAGEIDLATAGQVKLVVQAKTPPTVSVPVIENGNVILNGAGGPSNLLYYVLGSTNVAAPLAEWLRIGTNQFNAAGGFSFTNPLPPGTPQMFQAIEVP
jgi:autotransporter-associated beta strand protein